MMLLQPDALADAVVGLRPPGLILLPCRCLGAEEVTLTVLEDALLLAVVAMTCRVEQAVDGGDGLGGTKAEIAPSLVVSTKSKAALPSKMPPPVPSFPV